MPMGMTYASETAKAPCTLCTKMQKMKLSSIHNALFVKTAAIFNSLISEQRFSQQFFRKVFAVLCVVKTADSSD